MPTGIANWPEKFRPKNISYAIINTSAFPETGFVDRRNLGKIF